MEIKEMIEGAVVKRITSLKIGDLIKIFDKEESDEAKRISFGVVKSVETNGEDVVIEVVRIREKKWGDGFDIQHIAYSGGEKLVIFEATEMEMKDYFHSKQKKIIRTLKGEIEDKLAELEIAETLLETVDSILKKYQNPEGEKNGDNENN